MKNQNLKSEPLKVWINWEAASLIIELGDLLRKLQAERINEAEKFLVGISEKVDLMEAEIKAARTRPGKMKVV
jgi:hypothetical protein